MDVPDPTAYRVRSPCGTHTPDSATAPSLTRGALGTISRAETNFLSLEQRPNRKLYPIYIAKKLRRVFPPEPMCVPDDLLLNTEEARFARRLHRLRG